MLKDLKWLVTYVKWFIEKNLYPIVGSGLKCLLQLLERSKILPDNEGDRKYDGTLYNVQDTFHIKFNVFKDIVENHNLGCNGFLVYSILKSLCRAGKKLTIYQDELSSSYKINKRRLQDYLSALEKENYIFIERKRNEEQHPANTYYILK
ncbi:hypothetical protein ACRS6Y_17240 [Bacillus cytotoxicus]|uniref:hypothetical protein n=1 Tax=Bacillus cytotoxicus TaxID=580165 RepID=UPI003D7D1306